MYSVQICERPCSNPTIWLKFPFFVNSQNSNFYITFKSDLILMKDRNL